ncbi:glycosyltransferase family 2 protein [Nocardioides fonticola]|uniref:Glycosyltransferase family 2 protein n=1 Tax=Nocardioides fonticola TaxID=450363 RepID=A0ABP7XLQ6_9ACTN
MVVCTHRAERLPELLEAVASLRRQQLPPTSVLVVVDEGPDLERQVRSALADLATDADPAADDADAATDAAGPPVRVLGLGRNRGVSIARTEGARALDTDLVAFLDDDAVAHPDWLAVLADVLVDSAVLGAGGRSDAVFLAPRPRWLPEEFLWTVGCSYRGQPRTRARVRNVYGGCALLRREVFVDLGGFHPEIGHRDGFSGGGEEAEFCLRASAATGGVFAYEPATGIDHRVPGWRLTWRYYLGRCVAEGRMKARLARLGPGSTLGPERSFAVRLPVAIVRYLLAPPAGVGRSAAFGVVAGGLAVTVGMMLDAVAVRGGRR